MGCSGRIVVLVVLVVVAVVVVVVFVVVVVVVATAGDLSFLFVLAAVDAVFGSVRGRFAAGVLSIIVLTFLYQHTKEYCHD